tara:strand:+ start:578 stop:2389 length:1812 start_codon:yes stop_codon:yes gene_type:complete
MNLIDNNPYRILGISTMSTQREIIQSISDSDLYTKMNKKIVFDSDKYISTDLKRTPEKIESARQKLDRDNNKLFHSLFWFWENKSNMIDEMSFSELKKGNQEKAIDYWLEGTKNSINSENASNYKNLSILYMSRSYKNKKINKTNFLNSISLMSKFLSYESNLPSNGFFQSFSYIHFESKKIDFKKSLSDFINEILTFSNPHFSLETATTKLQYSDITRCFSPIKHIVDVENILTQERIQNLDTLIKTAENKRYNNESTCYSTGLKLYNEGINDLKVLKSILRKDNLKLESICDLFATEILNCAIAYFNHFRESATTDPGDKTFKLVKIVMDLAIGKTLKDRINKNYLVIKEFVDDKENREKYKIITNEVNYLERQSEQLYRKSEMYNMLETLDISQFINNSIPYLKLIKNKVGVSDKKYVEISSQIAMATMICCVKRMATILKNIENQFTAYEYTQAKSQVVIKNLEEIRPIFAKVGALNMDSKTRNTYTEYCQSFHFTVMYPKNPATKKTTATTSQRKNTTTSSSQGGCYIATMTYKDYDAKEVLILRNFRDNVLLKSNIGRNFVKYYYRYSPKFVEYCYNKKYLNLFIKSILNIIVRILK